MSSRVVVARSGNTLRSLDASLLVSCRDDGQFLESFVQSVNSLVSVEVEVVLVDDGSSVPIDPGFLEHLKPRWTLIRTEHLGLPAALNLAAGFAASDFLARHDLDDVSRPSRLWKQLQTLRDDHLDVVGSQAWITDCNLNPLICTKLPLEHKTIGRWLLSRFSGNPIVHGSVLVRREMFLKVGGYDPRFIKSQDLDLWIRLLSHGAKFGNLPTPEYLWRARAGSAGSSVGISQSSFAQIARSPMARGSSLAPPHSARRVRIQKRSDAFMAASAGSWRGFHGVVICWWKVRKSLQLREHFRIALFAVWSSKPMCYVRPLIRRRIRVRF